MGGIRKVGSRWVAEENEATEETLARQSIFSFVTQTSNTMPGLPREYSSREGAEEKVPPLLRVSATSREAPLSSVPSRSSHPYTQVLPSKAL